MNTDTRPQTVIAPLGRTAQSATTVVQRRTRFGNAATTTVSSPRG